MRFIALIAMTFVAGAALTQSSAALLESPTPASAEPAVDQLIPWLLDENQQLRGIAFGEVIFDTTGKKVLPFGANNAIDQRVAKAISAACDETMRELNAPDSAIQNVDRINEVSGHFEEWLGELLDTTPGLRCGFPLTAEGTVQCSGYPDLRVTDVESKRVFYLYPKLYLAGSRDSTSARFISSPRRRRTKCARTRCTSLLDLNARHASRMACGNSCDGILSIFRGSPSS